LAELNAAVLKALREGDGDETVLQGLKAAFERKRLLAEVLASAQPLPRGGAGASDDLTEALEWQKLAALREVEISERLAAWVPKAQLRSNAGLSAYQKNSFVKSQNTLDQSI